MQVYKYIYAYIYIYIYIYVYQYVFIHRRRRDSFSAISSCCTFSLKLQSYLISIIKLNNKNTERHIQPLRLV